MFWNEGTCPSTHQSKSQGSSSSTSKQHRLSFSLLPRSTSFSIVSYLPTVALSCKMWKHLQPHSDREWKQITSVLVYEGFSLVPLFTTIPAIDFTETTRAEAYAADKFCFSVKVSGLHWHVRGSQLSAEHHQAHSALRNGENTHL